MRLRLIALLVVVLAGCVEKSPETSELTPAPSPRAMAALANGGLRYGEQHTGDVFEIDADGVRSSRPVAEVRVSTAPGQGLLGLAVDAKDRTFAAFTPPDGHITVAQVAPGAQRVIWRGPVVSGQIGGRLAVSPQDRLVLSLGALDDASKVADPTAPNGKLLTLDPDRDAGQEPNAISSGWTHPTGLAYAAGGVLWVVDGGSNPRLARAGQEGTTGEVRGLPADSEPMGLTHFGDKELAVCFGKTHELQRFFVKDGTQTVPGRVIADDCDLGVVELADGRLAYATNSAVRITAN